MQGAQHAQAGVFGEPESAEALAKAILSLAGNRPLCREYGANGRRFVEKYYSRQAQARRLADLLEMLVIL